MDGLCRQNHRLLGGYSKGNQVLVVVSKLVDWVLGLLFLDSHPLILEKVAGSLVLGVEVYDSVIPLLQVGFAQDLVLELIDSPQTPQDFKQSGSTFAVDLGLEKVDDQLPES